MNRKLIFILLAALILRLVFVFSAYHGDLNNNISWGQAAVERGLNGFYDGARWSYSAPNQPPLYILLFAFCAWAYEGIKTIAWQLNGAIGIFPSSFIWFWEQKGMVLLVKLPSILADLGIGYLLYRYFAKKNNFRLGLLLALVWLFNPVSWYNSAIWGQTDAIVNLLGLLAVFLLLEKRLTAFCVAFAASLLFKGSLVVFAPILLVVTILQKHSARQWLKAIGSALLTVVAVSIWFHPHLDLPVWLLSLYEKRIFPGEIGYLTANAFNFWWLVDPGRTLDSTVYLGLPARIWGLGIGGLGTVGLVYWLLRGKMTEKRIFLSLGLLAVISFVFLTRIHERYLYPFFPLGTILLGLIPDFGIIYFFLSVSYLLNLYHLFWYPPFPFLEALYREPWFPIGISVLNLLLFVVLLRHLKAKKI